MNSAELLASDRCLGSARVSYHATERTPMLRGSNRDGVSVKCGVIDVEFDIDLGAHRSRCDRHRSHRPTVLSNRAPASRLFGWRELVAVTVARNPRRVIPRALSRLGEHREPPERRTTVLASTLLHTLRTSRECCRAIRRHP